MAKRAAINEKTAKAINASRTRLQSRYQNEDVDQAWAMAKQKALADANRSPMLDGANAEPLSFGAQCRSTVCLVGADFSSADAANDWSTLYTMLAGRELKRTAMAMSPNPDGTVHMEVYGLAR